MEVDKEMMISFIDMLSKIANSGSGKLSEEDLAVYSYVRGGANNLLWDIKYLRDNISNKDYGKAKELAEFQVESIELKKQRLLGE